jgi:hypothetical protein
MQTIFHVLLLDRNRDLLAWTKLAAYARGDGAWRATQDFCAEAERTGLGTALCFHWVDMNVHTTVPLRDPVQTLDGSVLTVPLKDTPLVQIGSDPRPLPAITVRTPVSMRIASAAR